MLSFHELKVTLRGPGNEYYHLSAFLLLLSMFLYVLYKNKIIRKYLIESHGITSTFVNRFFIGSAFMQTIAVLHITIINKVINSIIIGIAVISMYICIYKADDLLEDNE